ncbi:hypothetical protein NBRC10512_005221 [Rhodotorula toruloides]|uniref:RHTO0S13e01002g1_1 n=2 Tax=Rhodotorula toruloides TaxID=5286 RepID=A0A061BBN4_RHOTO|nr:Zn(2)-C6 fungal-type transcription factor [Rhodotorula toruloides NP11]EMS22542.1 Zn(2)-C6 fungal-type transcription factor [Rhodotorula toruloides NP11]CDR46752.1 RHTO0S13e01002g1_1 [Rhodotorula toruloides]
MSRRPEHPLASLSGGPTSSYALPPVVPFNAATSTAYTHSPDSVSSPTYNAGLTGRPGTASDGGAGQGPAKRRKVEGSGGNSPGGPASDAGQLVTGSKKQKAVSCTECKRRKIKCDRKLPCLACCKRGEPEVCKWPDETAKPQVDVQPFALTSDLVLLARRLQSLEEWANQLPPELRARAPAPQPFTPEVYGSKVKQSTKEKLGYLDPHRQPSVHRRNSNAGEHDSEHSVEPPSRDMSDTEDAAVKLESMAFTARAPNSQYRPQDSLPFFDNIPSPNASAQAAHGAGRMIHAYPAELTSYRTSIVAAPLVFEGPWTASAIGLDMCFSLEELKAARSRCLATIFSQLPDKALSYKLVEKYFQEVQWLHMIFHRGTFEAEHDRAWQMIEAGRWEEIDPMWLACYCMMLALAIDGLRCEKRQIRLTDDDMKRCKPPIWYVCAQRLMQLADGSGKPQVRFIQSVILIGQWLQCSSIPGQATRFLSLLAQAIRTAQILGLHQMTSDPEQMPPPDPAWPPNACSMRRETALRLFSLLSFLDYMSATTRFRSYLLDPVQCSSPPLSNLNQEDLSITDWRIDPKPRHVYTDSSFEYAKYRICQASRAVFEKLVCSPSTFSYDTVLELDRNYRSVLQECAEALSTVDPARMMRGDVYWVRSICDEGLHSRLVRLHRPFMAKHDYSRKCCLESAEKAIRAHSHISKVTKNTWFIYVHCLAAAICLFVDLFQAIDQGLPEKEIEQKKEVLVLAFEVFGQHDEISSPALRHVVRTGSKILSGLFMAEEKRRVTRAANALVGGNRKDDSPPESLAAVLQRLTKELDLAGTASPLPSSTSIPLPSATLPQATSNAGLAPPAAPAPSGMFAIEQPFLGWNPDPTYAPNVGTDAFMSSEFFRDVGLSAGLETGAFLPSDPNLYGGGGASTSAGTANGAIPFSWPFATETGTPGVGGADQGKMAASALMDQLQMSGGMW